MTFRGRVLKVRTGYNPNSSSIGVPVSLFVRGIAAAALLVNTAVALIAVFRHRGKDLNQ